MAADDMATRWLTTWLNGVGLHGLRPAPGEPLLRWLLSLNERAIAEHEAALEALSPDQAALADQLSREVISTQKDTLSLPDQLAIKHGDLIAVRAAEIAAVVWTLAGIDALIDPNDDLGSWRDRLNATATAAARVDAGLVAPTRLG